MMIRMILTDPDHTLLKQNGSVSGKTLQILTACRAKGIRFAIAAARYWIGVNVENAPFF
jgi:hydroxymethylpyrimidine pyrophosphatase-like HAD family hydrolase